MAISQSLNNPIIKLDPVLRNLLLFEIIFPVVLLILGLYHGFLQFLYRSGVLQQNSFLGLEYYQGLTLHGVINALVFTTFFAVAFGNAIIPYFLNKPISLKAALTSGFLMTFGTLLAAFPILTRQASVLYTFYPPLKAHPMFYIGATLLIIGSWVAFFNWIPPYLKWRRENPGEKPPLAAVGILATFVVWLIATIPVAYEVLVLLLPWSMGLVSTVNIPLARTLFWFFGHPLVYFWVMPAYIMYYVMLPKVAGGKLFSDFAGRISFMWFIVFSAPVGLHHQFTEPGLNSNWKLMHSFLTFFVALPSLMTAFVTAASMEHAARLRGASGLFSWWKSLPHFDRENWLFPYFFLGLVIFIFGGITGIVNASYNLNLVVHNTAWLPAHFHMTVAGPVFLAFIGMSLYMASKLTGKRIRYQMLNLLVPYIWTLGILISSFGAFVGGIQGVPRRTNLGLTFLNPASPSYRPDWQFYSNVAAIGGTLMFIAALAYFAVFFATLRGKREAEPVMEFPVSEVYHDENFGWVRDFKPWVIAGVLAVIIAYAPPLYEIYTSRFQESPVYTPDSPVPLAPAEPSPY